MYTLHTHVHTNIVLYTSRVHGIGRRIWQISTRIPHLLGRFAGQLDLLQSLRVLREHVHHVDVTEDEAGSRVGQVVDELADEVALQLPVQRLVLDLKICTNT